VRGDELGAQRFNEYEKTEMTLNFMKVLRYKGQIELFRDGEM